MPVIDAIDGKKYGRLLARHLPGIIRGDEEHDRLAELLMKLALADARTAEEERLIELLERLVDDYDERESRRTTQHHPRRLRLRKGAARNLGSRDARFPGRCQITKPSPKAPRLVSQEAAESYSAS